MVFFDDSIKLIRNKAVSLLGSHVPLPEEIRRVRVLGAGARSKTLPMRNGSLTCSVTGWRTDGMRILASAGVLVGFSGGGATPLIAANEIVDYMQHYIALTDLPLTRFLGWLGVGRSKVLWVGGALWQRQCTQRYDPP